MYNDDKQHDSAVCAAHYDEGYGAYGGGYDEGEYDNGYGDGYGMGYGAYGSRGGGGGGGGRMMSRGSGMRGMMGSGRAGVRGGRGGGRGRGGGGAMMRTPYESSTGHSVHMRGLPYSATESDIIQVTCKALAVLSRS